MNYRREQISKSICDEVSLTQKKRGSLDKLELPIYQEIPSPLICFPMVGFAYCLMSLVV
ncbi:hypothetical protein HMPREF1555_00819 [Porphyromonas gingivalis F0570]|uniref:Uncharacterized protein n=1 Tax=Porphyromonas gingivalis F0570 TaxID=1227271 RepID=A0A0E2LS09_PORGN|nr:hypothetical protein HMPREF1555_00819 [Porphyromonas gingivalis F0570]